MKKIAIIGGCGHVGMPLGLAFASRGFDVSLVDINEEAVKTINDGILPFEEEGAEDLLKEHIGKNLKATTKAEIVASQDVVFFVTGTPVDEHHNPRVNDVLGVIRTYIPFMSKDQLVVLRSTVYPGVIEVVENILTQNLGSCKLAFCPERIVQGKGIEEIFNLPQIVSATTDSAREEAAELFSKVAPKIIHLEPIEAELAKLITNSWRYLEFAIANQFYMMVEQRGLDFYKIFGALRDDYPRAAHYARPGLAAGPCLFKDTMQLSAFHQNNYFLGQAAMLVNEGLPNFLAEQLEDQLGGLKNKNVAILGMTFKANNDDTRESLSYKLKKILEFKMANVIECDPYIEGATELTEAVEAAHGVILGVPHREFCNLELNKPFVDCWGVWKKEGKA